MKRLCRSPHHAGPRWIHGIYFHASGWNEDGSAPVRLQSRCQACMRIEQRIRKGRKKRGIKFNPQRKMTKSQDARRKRQRYNRRQNAKRKGDPVLPLKPFAAFLRNRIARDGMAEVSRQAGVDEAILRRMAHEVHPPNNSQNGRPGRVDKWLDIPLSRLDNMAVRLDVDLNLLYDFDSLKALDGNVPRQYPTKYMRAAGRYVTHPSEPISEEDYRRRRRARRRREA